MMKMKLLPRWKILYSVSFVENPEGKEEFRRSAADFVLCRSLEKEPMVRPWSQCAFGRRFIYVYLLYIFQVLQWFLRFTRLLAQSPCRLPHFGFCMFLFCISFVSSRQLRIRSPIWRSQTAGVWDMKALQPQVLALKRIPIEMDEDGVQSSVSNISSATLDWCYTEVPATAIREVQNSLCQPSVSPLSTLILHRMRDLTNVLNLLF